jgi:phage gpG-like protein
MDPFIQPLQKLQQAFAAHHAELIDTMGVEALKFVDDNFAMSGYQGATFTPWPKRRSNEKGAMRKLLVQTGTLRRSIIKTDSTDHTTIHTDVVYAKIHNEGGEIRHPYRNVVLSFTGKPGSLKLGKTGTESQQRKITTLRRSSVYNHTTKMPQRQFMPITGTDAPVLNRNVQKALETKITQLFKFI